MMISTDEIDNIKSIKLFETGNKNRYSEIFPSKDLYFQYIYNTNLPMLNKCGEFLYAICTFQGVTSHQNQNVGSPRSKYKEALKSKQIEMGNSF